MALVAIPCEDKDLNASVSHHFGRAPAFTLVEVDGGVARVRKFVDNPTAGQRVHGALPRFLAGLGVKVVACFRIGPRAAEFLKLLGIKVVRLPPNVTTVADAIKVLPTLVGSG